MNTAKVKTDALSGPALDWAVATAEIAGGYYTTESKNYELPLLRMDPGWFASEYGQSVFGPGDGRWQGHGSKDGAWQARGCSWGSFQPSSSWEWAGPIIEREGIGLLSEARDHSVWVAKLAYAKEIALWSPARLVFSYCLSRADTPLIAAMRCYVMSKLGNEVEIPEGLQART